VCFRSPPSRMKATSRRMHHISKNRHAPTVEEREISRWPKLPYWCISFCFPENCRWWVLSNGLCAIKSLQSVSRVVGEEKYIQISASSNGGFRDMAQSIIGSSKFCTSLSSWILYGLSLFFFELVASLMF
jgi:hypothetical protein